MGRSRTPIITKEQNEIATLRRRKEMGVLTLKELRRLMLLESKNQK